MKKGSSFKRKPSLEDFYQTMKFVLVVLAAMSIVCMSYTTWSEWHDQKSSLWIALWRAFGEFIAALVRHGR